MQSAHKKYYNILVGDLVYIHPHPWRLSHDKSLGLGIVLSIRSEITDSRDYSKSTLATIYTGTGKTYELDIDYLDCVERPNI